MSFHWPHVLWILVVPLAAAVLELRRRRVQSTGDHPKIMRAEAGERALTLAPAQKNLPAPSRRLRWRLWAGLALLVVALARPQWGRIEEAVFDQSREILVALDLSRSMLADDVKPTRLDRAKLLITSLLEPLKGERVGLIVFAGTSFLQSPLSADYEILREFLPALTPDYLPEGGSNYQAMLQTAIDAFNASSSADRFLIVLSDGEATDDQWKRTAETLKAKGVRVLGLGVGTAEGAMLPDGAGGLVKDERGAVVLSKLESGTLQQLAEITGGMYSDASSWVDLAQLIETTIATARKGAFVERNRVRLADRYQWALAPAILLLLLHLWREIPVRPRARDLRLARIQPATTTAASLVLAATLIALAPHESPAQNPSAAPPAPSSAGEPLSKLADDFSKRASLSAREYSEFARTTLTYGERVKSAKQPVPEGPIRDGLAAVKEGEALDPKSADWAKLRTDLEKLLQKPPPPPEQKQQQPQQNDKNEKNDKENQDDSSQQNQSSQDQQQKSDSSKSDRQKSDQQQQKEQQPESKSDEKKDTESADKAKEQEKQSAFGDMGKQEKKEPPPAQPPQTGETQKVGGAQEKKEAPANADPALIGALQKLDRLKDQDSPAKLHQLMQEKKSPARPPGKNW